MHELALFAGAGGGILGGKLLGWRTVCAVEWEPYAACVLVARQNDKILPPFPIWDDVQTFDGKPWRGIVDVISGGFPCQDISAAGKGAGIEGERSGMWKHMARVVGEVRPKFVFVENSPMLVTRGLERVLCDLAALGYDTKWTVMGAADVGAPHQRDRFWLVAHANGITSQIGRHDPADAKSGGSGDSGSCGSGGNDQRIVDSCSDAEMVNPKNERDVWRQWVMGFAEQEHDSTGGKANGCGEWWKTEPNVGRVANGVAARVDRLKAIGNGQVPLCAATAWRLLTNNLSSE